MRTRYLVFAGDEYYPVGGAADYVMEFDSPAEAALGMPRNRDWAHVAELSRFGLVIVAECATGNSKSTRREWHISAFWSRPDPASPAADRRAW